MVIVVPDIDQYKQLGRKLRYKIVCNLEPLLGGNHGYPENEVMGVIDDVEELLNWVSKHDYSSQIRKKAQSIIEKNT